MLTNYEKLTKIRDNEKYRRNDWNGYEAVPISRELANLAMKLLSAVETKVFVSPTARGTIQFEWEDENGNYLELELDKDGKIEVYFVDDGEEEIEEED